MSGAARMLAPSAFLGLETDGGPQAHMVASLVQEQMGADGQPAFQHVRVMPDYGGTSRFVTAVRR